MAPLPTDQEDYAAMARFHLVVGDSGLLYLTDMMQEFWHQRLASSAHGALIRTLLECSKKAHRTRAEGWSACEVVIWLMTHGGFLLDGGRFRLFALLCPSKLR